jgi:hypothetical protein
MGIANYQSPFIIVQWSMIVSSFHDFKKFFFIFFIFFIFPTRPLEMMLLHPKKWYLYHKIRFKTTSFSLEKLKGLDGLMKNFHRVGIQFKMNKIDQGYQIRSSDRSYSKEYIIFKVIYGFIRPPYHLFKSSIF